MYIQSKNEWTKGIVFFLIYRAIQDFKASVAKLDQE